MLKAQEDLILAAEVTCASCSFAAVSEHRPDLVVLSLNMRGHRVLELVKDLLVLHARLKVLIVASPEQELDAGRVLGAGAHGCVAACTSAATKLDAMRQVLAGKLCFTPAPTPRPRAGALPSAAPSLHLVAATVAL